jgi:hypothetical protein
MEPQSRSLNAYLLVNSFSPGCAEGRERVLPFLEHFGVPYDPIDLVHDPLPTDLADRPLIILAHPQLDDAGWRTGKNAPACLRDALRAGAGLVSFDPLLSAQLLKAPEPQRTVYNGVEIARTGHPITALHEPGQAFVFGQPIQAAEAPGEPLLTAGDITFLGAASLEKGRLVTWSSTAWMDTRSLGPFCGMDDLFWRGLVWAARKPFFLRGLPPLVTMRVDDVAGRGGLWGETPLYWVEDCLRLGWKPWLGLFIYNNSPETVRQLQAFTAAGQVTVFPHAFGRPNRAPEDNFYYDPNGISLRADTYDEFIYFNHQGQSPWTDSEAERGLRAVDRWFADRASLPISRVALPHWYEMGANTVQHIADRWSCDMVGKPMDIDLPLAPGVGWLPLGPFRRFEPPGESFPFTADRRGKKPVYYADFLQWQGRGFFNSLTEIRDDAGYEWAPDNAVEAAIARGVRQIRRALNGMALASLFTHETDYIYKIRPENWRAIMEGITREIAAAGPRLVTLDEGQAVLRATKTSRLEQVSCSTTGEVKGRFTGRADCPTTFTRYETDSLTGYLVDVPAFEGQVEVSAG